MAKVNLKLNAERVFGQFLPTVYLKIASVHNNENTGTDFGASITDVVVKADLSISFTKPDTMTTGEADKFIRNNLNQLYLYAWLSPYENLNSQLELGRLRLKDLFNATQIATNTTVDNFTIDNVFFPYVYDEAVSSWDAGAYDFGLSLSDGKTAHEARDLIMDATIAGDGSGAGMDVNDYYFYYANAKDAPAMAAFSYITYPDALAPGTDVGTFMDGTSIQNLMFFGPNMIGPWNMPNTITDVEIRRRAQQLTTQNKIEYTTITTDQLEEFADDMMAVTDIPESAFETTADFYNYMLRQTLGITGFDTPAEDVVQDNISTTSSYFYEHVARFFETTDIQALSDFLNQFKKIKLEDLLSEPYGGHFNKVKQYDSKGKELLVIENIKLEFLYDSSGLERQDVAKAILESIQKLFFISTIGLDLDYIQSGAFESGEDADLLTRQESDRKIHRRLMNSFFGNITYEHVMDSNVVPNPYFTHYVYADDQTPYDGIPIQGLDGQLRAAEPISNENAISAFKNLIRTYTLQSKGDRRLQNHLNNLRLILEKYGHTANLVRELKRFQVTFTDKQRTHKSGQFYRDFNDILVTLNKKIINQKLVLQKLSINSTCIDMRPARPIGSGYEPPQPNLSPYYYTYGPGGSGMYGEEVNWELYDTTRENGLAGNSDFIPRRWSKLTRHIEYIDAGADGASYETAQVAEKILSKAQEELSSITLTAAGVDEEYVADFVEAEMASVNEAYEALGSSIGADQICKNYGYFFFDYEKALMKTSQMAQIIDLRKLAVFLGMSIPYEYYHVTNVSVKRKDLRLDFASISGTRGIQEDDFVETRMQTTFSQDRTVPKMNLTQHRVILPPDMSDEMKSVYGKPFVNTVNGTAPDGTEKATKYSCVKYVHFGVPDSVSIEQMLGGAIGGVGGTVENLHVQNDIMPYSIKHPHAAANYVNHVGIGMQLGMMGFKSYRMLAFEIEDYMDDDVALAGTAAESALQFQEGIEYSGYDDFVTGGLGSELGDSTIAQFNPIGYNGSWYEISITVNDRTLEYFSKIYNDLIKPFVDSFEEYVEYAQELCSYNKSNESFNDFFVEAMVDKYVTNTGGDLATAAAETFLEQLQQSILEEQSATLIGDPSSGETMDVSELNMATYAELVPPWVAGALLSVFIKEIFFNKTHYTRLYDVLMEISTPLSEYDPDSTEAPSQEVIKMMREMYQLSPQKGNLEAVVTFRDRLKPLIDILRLNDETIKDRLSEVTGLDKTDPDFAENAIASTITKKFYGSLTIDSPIVPGVASQGYYESSNITGVEAGASTYSANPTAFFYDELLNATIGSETSSGISRPTKVKGLCAPLVVTTHCEEIIVPVEIPTEDKESTGTADTDDKRSGGAGSAAASAGGKRDAASRGGGSTASGDTGGTTGTSSCVLAGTLVFTLYKQKVVEDVVVGDKVYSYNFETQEYGFYNVNSVMEPTERNRWVLLTTATGKKLKCTEDHPLYTLDRDNNELPINECNVGDKVYVVGDRGQLLEDTISSIDYHDEVVTVYNFEVDEVHSYLSDDILSHNKVRSGGGGRSTSSVGSKHRAGGAPGVSSGPRSGITRGSDY